MRGDFSAWNKDRSRNFRGTLHQQGRVLIDRDWNAQTEVFGEWQETAARDAFGPDVAAVPADEPLSFKITQAEKVGAPDHVEVSVTGGHLWADGLLVELAGNVKRTATYLQPPVQAKNKGGKVEDLPNKNIRDAVVLETWLEELSPFQDPGVLLEPALGGVDTTERVQTAYRFRLYRMGKDDKGNDETCATIKLEDDFSKKGKLTADLPKPTVIDGDCPVVEEGGYTGFEHRLYRIEIAETNRTGESYFKWSHFNGGLVGTGNFVAADNKVTLVGNKNAIINSGLNSFYLEALDFDAGLGCWHVIYGANVTLAADNTLTLPAPPSNDIFIGTAGLAEAKPGRFFRLWNGIARINDFAALKTTELPDKVGIGLKFDTEAEGLYTPSDFWTFEVRAALSNPLILIDKKPPQGIFYHRVPLAEVHWTGKIVTGDDIEDCRQIFQPLTKLRGCCTYRVGDGVHSHGDFRTIQAAINALPKTGGEVCVLPGLYKEQVFIKGRSNITLKGCGIRSRIQPDIEGKNGAIEVQDAQNISIKSLAVATKAIGVRLNGDEEKPLKNISLSDLFILGATESAVQGQDILGLSLTNSTIHIEDTGPTFSPGVYLAGNDMLIEHNEIRVLPQVTAAVRRGVDNRLTNDPNNFVPAKFAQGGLQIGGGSERVRILNNLIVSGRGNGITLGSIDKVKDGKIIKWHFPWFPKKDPTNPCEPPHGHVDPDDEDEDGQKPIAGPRLIDILIEFNRIFNMGNNGVGVAAFFALSEKIEPIGVELKRPTQPLMISVNKLAIIENRIEFCSYIKREETQVKLLKWFGNGGIALAHVEGLFIWDNFISCNGRDFNEPVCGIFILFVEGAEISRNHILGTRDGDSVIGSFDPKLKQGPRGGIYIARAAAPFQFPPKVTAVPVFPQGPTFSQGITFLQGTFSPNFLTTGRIDAAFAPPGQQVGFIAAGTATPPAPAGAQAIIVPSQGITGVPPGITASVPPGITGVPGITAAVPPGITGVPGITAAPAPTDFRVVSASTGTPAAVIHDNVVSVQVGRSLTIYATGPISVADNVFTSYGPDTFSVFERVNGNTTFTDFPPEPMVFHVADRIAGNILIADVSLMFPLNDIFGDLLHIPMPKEAGGRVAFLRPKPSFNVAGAPVAPLPPAPVFIDRRFLFTDNQCHQDNAAMLGEAAINSIAIFSSDGDVAFNDNQSACRYIKGLLRNSQVINLPLVHTSIAARTSRTNDNRLTEPIEVPGREAFTVLSAYVNGTLNLVTGNIFTHCIRSTGRDLLAGPNNPAALKGVYLNFIELENLASIVRCAGGLDLPIGSNIDPRRAVETLDDLHAIQLGETLRLEYEKHRVNRRELDRAILNYGDKHPYTLSLAERIKVNGVRFGYSAMEYAAATIPLPEPNGWAIDGFVRFKGSGAPVTNVIAGVYEAGNPTKKVFGDTVTDQRGYFSLVAPTATTVPPVIIRLSKDGKFLNTDNLVISPLFGKCVRVEVTAEDIDGFTSLVGGGGVSAVGPASLPIASVAAGTVFSAGSFTTESDFSATGDAADGDAISQLSGASESTEAEVESAGPPKKEAAKKPAEKKEKTGTAKGASAAKPAEKAPAKKPAKAAKPARPKKGE